ncbi:hypothetical protein CMUST_07380 [Corynebacterium mustelae]|uniref:Uncharacterized protein n=1 Tax=Corynebacterium mustelae TaxID=571915 RepID=A0A0G3GZ59_9CORY|nr:hypothetical protein [Corynebacterium mustelae]AKK05805.1 hypothetical protein CMUST_07380 [Corynebacterium mustelae]
MKSQNHTSENDIARIHQSLAELGWSTATCEQALTLPLGPKELQTKVRALLRPPLSIPDDFLNKDRSIRVLYAIRAAESPKNILWSGFHGSPEILAQALHNQGVGYVQKVGNHFTFEPENEFEGFYYSNYRLGVITAISDPEFNCPIPDNPDYLRAWGLMAAISVVKLDRVTRYFDDDELSAELLEPRFDEHCQKAIELDLPLWGPWGYILSFQANRGRCDRAQLIARLLTALEVEPRTQDRRIITEILTKELKVTTEDLLAHQEVIAQLLGTADPMYVNAFAAQLIPAVEESNLFDVALGALYVKTLKGQKIVLDALAKRNPPSLDIAESFAPSLQTLADSADTQVAKRAADLMGKWGLAVASTSEKPETSMWRETPPLWEVPRFEPGEGTLESVIAALKDMPTSPGSGFVPRSVTYSDLSVEIFLHRYHELARKDGQVAKRAIQGAPSNIRGGIVKTRAERSGISWWQNKDGSPVVHRDEAVLLFAQEMPCILSAPSFEDLRITLDDFLDRLEQYDQLGRAVQGPDLVLALLRLDLSGADVDAAKQRLKNLNVPIKKNSLGSKTQQEPKGNAAVVASIYLSGPYVEPPLRLVEGMWFPKKLDTPRAISSLHDQLRKAAAIEREIDPAAVPNWGDAAWVNLCWSPTLPVNALGKMAAQAARLSRPFGPGLAANMLEIQRPTRRGELVGVREALWQSWERGLLRPGVADLCFLSTFKGVAATWEELARDGLLSVVWPLFDAILTYASECSSPTAGASEIAEAMARLAPHVVAAVDSGVADKSALEAPGARAWSGKTGSSKVVKAAKQVVEALGVVAGVQAQPQPVKKPKGRKVSNLTELWAPDESTTVVFHPETTMKVIAGETSSTAKELWTEFQLPNYPDQSFIIPVPMIYSIDVKESNWRVYERQETPLRYNHRRYKSMYWDGTSMVVTKGYDTTPIDSPRPAPQPVIVAALAGLSAGTGDRSYSTYALLRGLVKHKRIGTSSCRQAVQVLMASGGLWSPAKAMSIINGIPEFLPQLWPLVTDTIAFAAGEKTTPRWLNKVLDAALANSESLVYGTEAGHIKAEDWAGLVTIADQKKASAARTKAQELKTALNL